MFMKRWLARKRDFEEIIQYEVSKALRKMEDKFMSEMDELRMKQHRQLNDIQVNLNKETTIANEQLKKEYKMQEAKLVRDHETEIRKLKTALFEQEAKVAFAQDFWRKIYSHKDELLNLATMLQSKAVTMMQHEHSEFQKIMIENSRQVQDINIAVQKIEILNKRIEKAKPEAEKLMMMN